MRFFADEMLGKLARWLRALGADVSYEVNWDDEKILALAKRQERIVLTRDHKLFKRLQNIHFPSLFIDHDHLEDQMRQFFRHYPGLKTLDRLLTRCMECNEMLESVAKEKVKDQVWPFVYETQDQFSYCKRCDRVYWRATHVNKIVQRLEELVKES
ncbi:MAG: Mut7-C RNAse domain-containing protein [bacterium]